MVQVTDFNDLVEDKMRERAQRLEERSDAPGVAGSYARLGKTLPPSLIHEWLRNEIDRNAIMADSFRAFALVMAELSVNVLAASGDARNCAAYLLDEYARYLEEILAGNVRVAAITPNGNDVAPLDEVLAKYGGKTDVVN